MALAAIQTSHAMTLHAMWAKAFAADRGVILFRELKIDRRA
jgi:hypothetical protein